MTPSRFWGQGPQALNVSDRLPSGQAVELFEVLLDTVGAEAWVRFRFLAPDIGPGGLRLRFDQVEPDFEHLCQSVVVPYVREFDLKADVVAIALLDRPIDFGSSDPEATQYIEAFRLDGETCIWEGLW
jgi:hypothetical protein